MNIKKYIIFTFLLFPHIVGANGVNFGMDIITNATEESVFNIDSNEDVYFYLSENFVVNLCTRNEWAIREEKFVGCKNPLTLKDFVSKKYRNATLNNFEYSYNEDSGKEQLILYLDIVNLK